MVMYLCMYVTKMFERKFLRNKESIFVFLTATLSHDSELLKEYEKSAK